MASVHLTGTGKVLFFVALIVAGYFGLRWYQNNFVHEVKQESKVLANIDLPEAPKNAQTTVQPVEFPADVLSPLNKEEIRVNEMAWNSQMGFNFANGGPRTTKGSLMEKHGVKLNIIRQDDCEKMQQDLLQFAAGYKDGSTNQGVPFCMVMGDGAAAFLSGVNSNLEKLGSEYKAKIVFSCGRSLGEDKLMGPKDWRENPRSAIGKTVAAYLRDGDWNIAVKWASDNGIPVNPDETTYDPNALNFIAAGDFLDACDKYITGYTETRKVVINGKTTGATETVNVDGVATWTPGDVRIAESKGGLISIVSTKEYRSQMPNVLIGIDKYMKDNPKAVEGIISAVSEAGDQIKCYSAALNKAGEISAKIYNENDGAYWVKYYNGVKDFVDKKGNVVELGGSRVHNLADNVELFGLNGGTNIYGVVYKVFGDVVVDLYPTIIPSYPPVEEALDLSYLKNVVSRTSIMASADEVKFNADDNIRETVSEKNWSIEFETGRATFTPQAEKQLEHLFNDLVVASNLKVEISGHTDNTGNADANMILSEQRAFAIKEYLERKSPKAFPQGRITVRAFGQTQPLASNTTVGGRAKNRRVDVKLGN